MSKECGFIVNGQKSPLYDKILEAYNGIEELAIPLHSYFRNNEKFLKDFGNWVEDYGVNTDYYFYKPGELRIEDNGEPKLFKNEKNGNYYYIDKDKNKVEVIENTSSLSTLFSTKEINRITDVLVANFTKEDLGIDFENIDLNENAITVRESIVKKLNERVETFYESGNEHFEDIAWSLETALDSHLDELVKNVVNSLEGYKIKSSEKFNDIEDTDLANIEENENQKDPSFGRASYEMSTKGNISANTKLRLSLIPNTSAKDNFLNSTVYLSFDEVYASLLPYLTNQVSIEKDGSIEDKFDLMKSVILSMSEKKPYFKELYSILDKAGISENIKNEFTQAFNLDMNNFNTSEYSYEESTDESTWVTLEDGTVIKPKLKTFKNINVSETGKKQSDVFSEWNKNFKDYFVTETKDSITINKESKDKLELIKKDLNKVEFGKPDSVQDIIKVLRKLGIENTVEGVFHFLDDFKLINNDNELSEEKFNLLKTDLNWLITRIINDSNNNYDNILSDQGVVTQLAKAEAFYISEGSDSSVFTGGKQKWVFSYPSYLSNTIKSWKKDRGILLKHYEVSKYNEGSDWMKYLLALGDTYQVDEYESEDIQEQQRIEESKNRINNLDIYTFNTSQEEGKSIDGKTGKDISKSEYISDTMNKILGFKVGRKAYYRTTTPADKSTQLEIAIGRYFETNARYDNNGNVVLNGEIYDLVYNYFDAEYKRMNFEREFMKDPNNADKLRIYYHTDNKGRVGMHFDPTNSKRTYFDNLAEYEAYPVEGTKQLLGHAFESQLFPSLSPGEIKATLKDSNLKFENIYDANGYAYLSTTDNANFKPLIQEYIKNELSKGVQETQDSLIKNKVFNETPGGITNIELDSKIWDSYQSDNALKASADFFINSLVSHVEYSKMFAGDVAYYKNAVDYKKRVPATYTDGLYQRLNDSNKEYTVAVTSSVNIAEPFLPELVEMLGEELGNKYDDVNAADAQAWITPERWKSLMNSMGKWNATYDSAYSKLIGENNEPFTEKELKFVAPPVKGVYFQVVNGVPIFLKYSQAVLSPRLRKGNGLEKMYNQMVTQKIDELVTFDAIKVGSNLPITIHKADGSLEDSFEFKPFIIPSNGWKLQQDLPVKTMHDTDVGSQIQKNIFQGLAFNLDKSFTLDNLEVSGNQIVENIANVTGALSNLGYEAVLKEFGIGNDGIITDLDGFYNSIISELKSTGGSQNVIDALESEIAIYGVAQAKPKLENIFSSILTKRILKIKTNGGSFIQMSNFGLNNEQANQQGVIWNPRALKTTHPPQFLKDKNGEFVLSENGKKIIRPGGILLSGSFIAKYIPDYRKYIDKDGNADKLFGYNNENGEFVEGVIDRKILENIIGYRIPNQGLSSNDALEIVGILPEENGDTVVAYTGITTKTGSDFDIDKMYMMFPTIKPYIKGLSKLLKDSGLSNKVALTILQGEGFKDITLDRANETLFEYLENKMQNEEIIPENLEEYVKTINSILDQKIVSKLKYVNYDNSKSESEQTKGSLQNRLIELYKSVLLNENVIGEVMTPVDFDHFKNDIRSIVKEKDVTNLSTFNQLNDIDVKYSFLAGKAGVGQQANALMDYVLGSLGNLSITNFTVPKSNTKLDMEYSQKLSSEDLEYYAKQLKLSDEQVNKLQSIKISHSLSAILNAFVDIAKDPYITEGNWVTMTTNTGNLLLRKGVHPFYVNAFLAQPVIKEYVDFSASYESSDNQDLNTSDAFIAQRFGKESYEKRNGSNIFSENLKTLRTEIGKNNDTFQMNVLSTFLKYQSASKAIKTNIDASKFMVNGVGGSVNSLIISKNRVDSILEAEKRYNELSDEDKKDFKDNIILGFRSKFTNPNGSESMFSKYYSNIIVKPEQIVKANPKQFLAANDTIQDTFNEISHDSKNEILLDEDLGKDLDKTFYSYIMSGFDSLHIDSSERKDLTLNFPKEFKQFKENNKGLYAIVDEITVNQGNTLDFVGLNNRKKSQDYEKLMVDSFLDLLNKDEEFANKLIKYSYLVSGFNNNKSQFFSMIPTQWFNRNNINRYILDKSAEYNSDYVGINDDNFIDQYYLANLENKKLVKNISQGQVLPKSGSIHGFVVKKPGKVGYFRVKSDDTGQNPDVYYKLAGYNEEYQGVYTRFIPNINDTLSEIKPLNVKDKKGNRIINYDTNGINLKPVTETSPGLTKNIDKTVLSKLHNSAIYSRDKFYRENVIIKKDEIVNVDEVATEDNQVATVAKSEIKDSNTPQQLNLSEIGITQDIFQYYGLTYKISIKDGIAIDVLNYKGKISAKQKILDFYNIDKDVDPQNGKNWRKNYYSIETEKVKEIIAPELTEDQQKVSTFIQDFLSKPVNNSVDSFSTENMIMITGPGGTGKTFTITRAIKEYSKKEYVKVAFAAPTHNAKRELTLSMKEADFNQPAMTNLTLFGIDYNPLSGKNYLKEVSDFYTPPIYYTNVIILDEYSMLGGESLKLIKERLKEIKEKEGRNIQIIFSGDYGQIPPVVDTKSSTDYSDGEITNLIYHNNKEKVVSLTKNMRSKYEDVAKQGQILRTFIDRVNDISIYKTSTEKIEDVVNDFKNNFLKVKNITKNVNIYPAESKLEWMNNYLKLFRQNSKNSLKFGVIVNYNNENHVYTSKINEYVRKELFNTDEKFVNGELIMMQSNEFEAKKDNNTTIVVGKEERLLINDVNKVNKKFSFEYRNKGDRNIKYFSINVPVFEINAKNDSDENVNFDSLNLPNKIIDYFKDNSQLDIKDLNLSGEIPLNTRQIFALVSQKLADITYGYVVNSHKVQGSSYGETFVDEDNIVTAKNFKEQLQLLYTAYTRSKFKTHVKTSLVMAINKVEDFIQQETLNSLVKENNNNENDHPFECKR